MSIVDPDFLLSVVGFSPADLASLAHLMVGQDDYEPVCDPCYEECGADAGECGEAGWFVTLVGVGIAAAFLPIMLLAAIPIFGTMFAILVAAILALIVASPFLLAFAVFWFITIGVPYLIYLALDELFPGMFTWVG